MRVEQPISRQEQEKEPGLNDVLEYFKERRNRALEYAREEKDLEEQQAILGYSQKCEGFISVLSNPESAEKSDYEEILKDFERDLDRAAYAGYNDRGEPVDDEASMSRVRRYQAGLRGFASLVIRERYKDDPQEKFDPDDMAKFFNKITDTEREILRGGGDEDSEAFFENVKSGFNKQKYDLPLMYLEVFSDNLNINPDLAIRDHGVDCETLFKKTRLYRDFLWQKTLTNESGVKSAPYETPLTPPQDEWTKKEAEFLAEKGILGARDEMKKWTAEKKEKEKEKKGEVAREAAERAKELLVERGILGARKAIEKEALEKKSEKKEEMAREKKESAEAKRIQKLEDERNLSDIRLRLEGAEFKYDKEEEGRLEKITPRQVENAKKEMEKELKRQKEGGPLARGVAKIDGALAKIFRWLGKRVGLALLVLLGAIIGGTNWWLNRKKRR